MVEHAAHNGIDVGSSPAKPKTFSIKIKMQFSLRDYQLTKVKQLFQKELLLLSNGASQDSKTWLTNIKPSLHYFNLKPYKIYNKITLKAIKNSIYKNMAKTINGTFFLFSLNYSLISINKVILKNGLEPTFFNLLALKLNKKIYSMTQIKSIYSLKYKSNMSLFYQYLLRNLKLSYSMF